MLIRELNQKVLNLFGNNQDATIKEYDVISMIELFDNTKKEEARHKIIDMYNKTLKQKYHSKETDGFKFRDFKTEFLSDTGSIMRRLTYNKHKMIITETTSVKDRLYPLTIKEIFNVLDFYDLLYILQSLDIIHDSQMGTQAFVETDIKELEKKKFERNLTLCIPCDEMIARTEKEMKSKHKINMKTCTLRILLHEISHALGNIGQHKGCEPEADRFSYQELDKWIDSGLINLEDEKVKNDDEVDEFGF